MKLINVSGMDRESTYVTVTYEKDGKVKHLMLNAGQLAELLSLSSGEWLFVAERFEKQPVHAI